MAMDVTVPLEILGLLSCRAQVTWRRCQNVCDSISADEARDQDLYAGI
jgi:hypothetical protein